MTNTKNLDSLKTHIKIKGSHGSLREYIYPERFYSESPQQKSKSLNFSAQSKNNDHEFSQNNKLQLICLRIIKLGSLYVRVTSSKAEISYLKSH